MLRAMREWMENHDWVVFCFFGAAIFFAVIQVYREYRSYRYFHR